MGGTGPLPEKDGQPVEAAIETDEAAIEDVVMVLYQVRIGGSYAPEEAARLCREYLGYHPLPEEGRLGVTTVVLARVERPDGGDRSAEAEALLMALTGSPPRTVRGGPLVRRVELWARTDDLDWLALLCDDDDRSEHDAASRLYGELWFVETFAHKIDHQAEQFRRERERLKAERAALRPALDRLTEALRRRDWLCSPDALHAAMEQNFQATLARRDLIESMGHARRMRTGIEANRANLVAYKAALGDGPGQSAFETRLLRIDQALHQIRTDLESCQPLLEAVADTCELHRTQVMTVQGNAEIESNRLRESFHWWIAVLGIWIGLMQIATGILGTFLTSPDADFGHKVLVLLGPTLLVGLGLATWGALRLATWGAVRLVRWLRSDGRES